VLSRETKGRRDLLGGSDLFEAQRCLVTEFSWRRSPGVWASGDGSPGEQSCRPAPRSDSGLPLRFRGFGELLGGDLIFRNDLGHVGRIQRNTHGASTSLKFRHQIP
jgi:hypothetical protein